MTTDGTKLLFSWDDFDSFKSRRTNSDRALNGSRSNDDAGAPTRTRTVSGSTTIPTPNPTLFTAGIAQPSAAT